MLNNLFLRSILLFLVTTCFALALQNSAQYENNDVIYYEVPIVREKRAAHKPGFFRTLFSVIYEQWADTKNTINSVQTQINDNFLPENPPVTEATTESSNPNITTTKAPFRITRSEFNKILQRNLKGLVRLFNLELNDALVQSRQTDKQFNRNLSLEASKFL